MSIRFFCPRWGSEDLNWDPFMEKVKAAGYDGIEWAITGDTSASLVEGVWKKAQKYGLLLIAQHYDTHEADYRQHYERYAGWLERVRPYPWTLINSQTGKDHFSFLQNAALIELAGDQVVHETHRGKFSFAAHITAEYIQKIKGLRLTLDVSHWVNVAESFLEDQAHAMELVIGRTAHIHARVGYPEGPQVPDPRAPEWQFALERHLDWWDRVVACKRQRGKEPLLTITPEFGPNPYLVHLPYGGGAISDQWAMNEYMMILLRGKYT